MDWMQTLLTGFLFPLTLTGSAAALLLLILQPLVWKNCSPRFQYLSWAVPLLFFLFPLRVRLGRQNSALPLLQELPPVVRLDSAMRAPVAQPAAMEQAFTFYDLLGCLWLAGVVVCAFSLLLSSRRFFGALRRHAHPVDDPRLLAVFAACKQQKRVNRRIPLLRCPLANTPMLAGILHPRILLPDLACSEEELRFVLLHELTHYRNGDLPLKLAALAVRTLHWFNPLAWLALRRINLLCEFACDAAATVGMPREERRAYGMALVSVMRQGAFPPPVSSAFSLRASDLKKRLALILDNKRPTRLLSITSAVLLVLLAAAGVLVSAYVRNDLPPEQRLVQQLTGSIELDAGGTLSFTVPADLPMDGAFWNIHVSGRARMGETGSMSLHLFEEHAQRWKPGESYSTPVPMPGIEELDFSVSLFDARQNLLAEGGWAWVADTTVSKGFSVR